MYDDDLLSLTPEQLVSACRREGILWLVIVKPKAAQGGEEGTVKLKSVLRGSEEESEFPRSLFLCAPRRYRRLAKTGSASPKSIC